MAEGIGNQLHHEEDVNPMRLPRPINHNGSIPHYNAKAALVCKWLRKFEEKHSEVIILINLFYSILFYFILFYFYLNIKMKLAS